jgi:hypothetical protein
MKNLVLTAFALVITVTLGLASANATTPIRLTSKTLSAANLYTNSATPKTTLKYSGTQKAQTITETSTNYTGVSAAAAIQSKTVENTNLDETTVLQVGTGYETSCISGCSPSSDLTYGGRQISETLTSTTDKETYTAYDTSLGTKYSLTGSIA